MTNLRILNDMLILELHVLSEPQPSRLNHAMRRKLHGRRCTRTLEHILAELLKVITLVKLLCDVQEQMKQLLTRLNCYLTSPNKRKTTEQQWKRIVPEATRSITKEARGVFCFLVMTNMQ